MGQYFVKFCEQTNDSIKLEEINLLKLENENLKNKLKSIEKYSEVLKEELQEIKQDYDSIIIKLSEIIK